MDVGTRFIEMLRFRCKSKLSMPRNHAGGFHGTVSSERRPEGHWGLSFRAQDQEFCCRFGAALTVAAWSRISRLDEQAIRRERASQLILSFV